MEVIAAAETWLDGQTSELFFSDLQKLEFRRYSLIFRGRAKDLSAPPVITSAVGLRVIADMRWKYLFLFIGMRTAFRSCHLRLAAGHAGVNVNVEV